MQHDKKAYVRIAVVFTVYHRSTLTMLRVLFIVSKMNAHRSEDVRMHRRVPTFDKIIGNGESDQEVDRKPDRQA